MELNIKAQPNKSVVVVLSTLFLLVTLGKYNLYIGFALKPYMLFCILFLLFQFSKFRFQKLQLFEIFMFLFYFVYLYTGAFSLYPGSSMRIMFGVIIYLCCYIVIKDIIKGASYKVIEKSLGIAGLLFNLISLILYFLGLQSKNFSLVGDGVISYGVMFDRDYPRLIGAVQDPNIFIFYNTLFFSYFLCNTKSWINKTGLMLCILTSLLTFSRGGILAMALVFFIYFLMSRPAVRAKLLFGMATGLFVLSYVMTVHLKFDLYSILMSRIEDFSSDGGSGRFELWERALEFFSSHMVYGIGAFNYRDYNFFFYGDSLYPHNTFLDILSESGLIGLFFYGMFILLLIFQLIQSKMYRHTPYLFLTFIGFMLQLVSLSFMINDMFFLYLAILSQYMYIGQACTPSKVNVQITPVVPHRVASTNQR
jgi:O-antigen ligase